MQKFVLLGQPRSGTTFLVDLITAKTDAICENELFNPSNVVYVTKPKDASDETLASREAYPEVFLEGFYSSKEYDGCSALGFNFMLGHNVDALKYLLEDEDIKIIYLRRDNKLAQFSSWKKALTSSEWATKSEKQAKQSQNKKLNFNFKEYNRVQNPITSHDEEMRKVLDGLNDARVLNIEYSELFNEATQDEILSFIGALRMQQTEHKGLKKQGLNRIVDRFENSKEVSEYFEMQGKAHWLGEEIKKTSNRRSFVVVAQTKTGSSYLVDSLNTKTSAYCSMEEFSAGVISKYKQKNITNAHDLKLRDFYPVQFVEQFYAQDNSCDALGFKILIGQSFQALNHILNNTDYKIIYLSRENKLAQYASSKFSAKTKVWATRNDETIKEISDNKITFNRNEYITRVGHFTTNDYLFDKCLKRVDPSRVFKLEYSDFVRNEKQSLADLADFLGVQSNNSNTPRFLKLGNNNILSRFDNQDHVSDVMKSFGKAHWLQNEI